MWSQKSLHPSWKSLETSIEQPTFGWDCKDYSVKAMVTHSQSLLSRYSQSVWGMDVNPIIPHDKK